MTFTDVYWVTLLQVTSHCSTTNFTCSIPCCLTRLSAVINYARVTRQTIEHLYSPRMVGEIKEKKTIGTSNKQTVIIYDLTILTILTTVYNIVTITNKKKDV